MTEAPETSVPLFAVIMAGGSGTRFWPLSRRRRPKHLLPLFGGLTLLQHASARAISVAGPERTLVITRKDQVDSCREQLPSLPPNAFLAEPVGRDTAMCLAFSAAHLLQIAPDAAMLALPADHAIEPLGEFVKAVRAGEKLLKSHPGLVVTFGIKPDRPATGYGYIERSDAPLDASLPVPAYRVARFHEKPDRARAEQYVQSGRFFWNSGIFLWRISRFLELLEEFAPDIARSARVAAEAWARNDDAAYTAAYESAPRLSIDFALMEHIPQATAVLEAPFHWDDLGSWHALARHIRPDATGNTVVGRFAGIDCHNLIVYAEGNSVVAAIGVDDLVIVHTQDATLVCRASEEERVKQLVSQLEEHGWSDVL